ncbi:MAG TPA: LLM class flavin-dependent oxidoreductase, partial [Myxococcota bacterium]|nr:LLM class flavin-dependent oxidoreductase [Myxococcota bacterium]
MKLGIAFTWHTLPFAALLELVRRAEAAGYAAAYVDGDVSMLESRGDADVLDGWTLTTALLARTQRIALGSIRLPHHW